MRYRGKKKPKLPADAKDVEWFIVTPDIISVDESGKISALKTGQGIVCAKMNGNRSVTYNIEVNYEPWQWIIIIFFFGFAWY